MLRQFEMLEMATSEFICVYGMRMIFMATFEFIKCTQTIFQLNAAAFYGPNTFQLPPKKQRIEMNVYA